MPREPLIRTKPVAADPRQTAAAYEAPATHITEPEPVPARKRPPEPEIKAKKKKGWRSRVRLALNIAAIGAATLVLGPIALALAAPGAAVILAIGLPIGILLALGAVGFSEG